MNSVLFDIASTLANVEALGLDAIKNMLAALDWEEFAASGTLHSSAYG